MMRTLASSIVLAAALAAPARGVAQSSAGESSLADRQRRIAATYRRLDAALVRLAEVLARQEPAQAQTVRDAAALSRERLVQSQLERLIESLDARRLKLAIDGQQSVTEDLQRLLEVLTQGDPRERLRSESQRMAGYLRDIRRLQAAQRSTRQATESPGDPSRNAERQSQHAEQSGELAQRMNREDSAAEADPSESAPGAPSLGSPSGSPSSGSPAPGSPGQQGPTAKASEQLRKAQEAMRSAQEALEKAQRDQAVDEQQKALDRLADAEAEIERILRQLRETERQQALAELESRFREMLREEIEIREATLTLDAVPAARRGPNEQVAASRLGRRQGEVRAMADAVLTLLREDGTALAMAEAVTSVRADMGLAARRLDVADVGPLTQSIEQDVVTALEELLAAVQKARRDAESSSGQPPDDSDRPPGQQPLVDLLAELKVIRALQNRINQRTERYHQGIERGELRAAEIAPELAELSGREERVFEATRNLVDKQNEASGGGP